MGGLMHHLIANLPSYGPGEVTGVRNSGFRRKQIWETLPLLTGCGATQWK